MSDAVDAGVDDANIVRLLVEPEIRGLVDQSVALRAVRSAAIALAQGEVTQPDPFHMDFAAHSGEAHVKGAYVEGSALWAVKVASGFYGNGRLGYPVASGVSLVFSANTGFLHTVLLDNGYLTDLRTGAAGALAADLLANPEIQRAAVIGCGTQARHQLAALLGVRRPKRVVAYGRDPNRLRAFGREMACQHELDIDTTRSIRDAVEGADLIITTTPSRQPLVQADWVSKGCHVTAVGADSPHKQELDTALLARAEVLAADSLRQASSQGELHHALTAGVVSVSAVVELGNLASGQEAGRRGPDDVTIADLTGLGAADALVATGAAGEAERRGIGWELVVR